VVGIFDRFFSFYRIFIGVFPIFGVLDALLLKWLQENPLGHIMAML